MKRAFLALAGVAATALATAAAAGADPAGFRTSQPPLLLPVKAGVSVEPIISVGDTLKNGYMFEAIPDGISVVGHGQGRADVYVNHETSTVPFPFTPATGVGFNDFTNAMLSNLKINAQTHGVLDGEYVIPSEANYQRFCSNFLAGAEQGFERDLILTNEEATDVVNRVGTAWPATPANGSQPEQAGVVVAYDVKSGAYKTIYGMGRHNHENSVAVPGYGHPVVLSGDDTFTAPSSQLYLYTADSAAAVWNDEGTLWAFKSDVPTINDYGDLTVGGSVSGRFIEVPKAIATGDQTGLENWSNANGVFQFIRVEDIAYDRTNPNVVYVADTGEPRAVPGPGAAYMTRGPSSFRGPYMNGRLFKLVLDQADPTKATLSIAIDADAGGYNNPMAIHQLDNLETTARSVLIQEDPGGHNQVISYARLWRYDIATGATEVLTRVDQSQVPSTPAGAWESSGIVDVSDVFGPDMFLADVQAGTLIVNEEQRGPLLYQREGGQLLLVHIPGA
ncbi:MAG TPA: hypothetical protein VLB86_02405 [Gaiellaceae bacterium]|nr:hypothetical protein [Gaiellaceae bacterium]